MNNKKNEIKESSQDVIENAINATDECMNDMVEKFQNLEKLYKELQSKYNDVIFSPFDEKSDVSKWSNCNSFKSRLMTQLIKFKDTSSKITPNELSNALDIILKVIEEANSLKSDDTEIRFADRFMDIKDINILDIFSGAFTINEVSDDFDTIYSKRYFVKSVIPLGHKRENMPTVRQFQEAQHLIRSQFRYMSENYLSVNSLHSTLNVSNVMKECAHKVGNKFNIARRNNSDSYFIPYYCEDFNDNLCWKDEYYGDDAMHYVDEYFDKFVYNILKGKKS